MNDAELRQYVRKHGRREVLSAILEGLSTYEQAELFREHTRIHPILLAMTGEEFKLMGPDAQVVSARFGNEPRPDKPTKQRVLDGEKGFVQGFQIHFDVAYRAGQSKPSAPRFPPAGPFAGDPDIYIMPTVSRAMLRGLTDDPTPYALTATTSIRIPYTPMTQVTYRGPPTGASIRLTDMHPEVGTRVDYMPFDEHRDAATDQRSTKSPPPPSSPSDRIQVISATSDPTP